MARLRQRRAVEVIHQDSFGSVGVHEFAAVDVAVAGAVLQRDAPLPARLVRGGAGQRHQRAVRFARHRNRAVARQPVAPVLVAGLQRFLDQQADHAGAVDEQVGRDALAAFHDHRVDEAVVLAQDRVDDLALGADHAALFRVLAQEFGVQAGVEMEGVVDVGQRRVAAAQVGAHELGHARRHRVDRKLLEAGRFAGLVHLQPVLVELGQHLVAPDRAEAVDVRVALLAPVDELDPELERALGRADEVVFVDADQVVEAADQRDGRFAHADGGDFVRFDQADAVPVGHQRRQRGCAHPAGSAAADNDDILNVIHVQLLHWTCGPFKKGRGAARCGEGGFDRWSLKGVRCIFQAADGIDFSSLNIAFNDFQCQPMSPTTTGEGGAAGRLGSTIRKGSTPTVARE